MPNHLTPPQLAEQLSLEPRQVVKLCHRHGVPIYQGRIDKTLFVRSVQAGGKRLPPDAVGAIMAEA